MGAGEDECTGLSGDEDEDEDRLNEYLSKSWVREEMPSEGFSVPGLDPKNERFLVIRLGGESSSTIQGQR